MEPIVWGYGLTAKIGDKINKILALFLMLVFFISIGFASANENVTENISLDDCEVSQMIDDVKATLGNLVLISWILK